MKSQDPSKTYHSLSSSQVLETLGVDPGRGLSQNEITRRHKKYGPNKLQAARTRSWKGILVDQFKSVVIIVLVIAGAVAFLSGHWAEGIAIAAVLAVNAAIGFVTEWKAVGSMEALRAMGGDVIRVRRDGKEKEINSEHIVPGDIIYIEAGDLVPADARLIESNQVRVNESTLTGESVSVRKKTEPVSPDAVMAERSGMLYKGTTIMEGSGEGVVTAIGVQTELGRISQLARDAEKEVTPLQKRLDQMGRRLAIITIGLAFAIAAAGLAAGQDTFKMIETAIALGVAAIPEGLPIVSTIALARGMHLMALRNVLITKLPAVETLGATQVIFTDKTGTLTENRMTLRRVLSSAGDVDLEAEKDNLRPDDSDGLQTLLNRIIEVGVLCNNAVIEDADSDGKEPLEQGDPTETALLRAGRKFDLERPRLLKEKPEMEETSFDPGVMMMATCHRIEQGVLFAVKGAPNRVLEACTGLAGVNGTEEKPLSDDIRQEWQDRIENLAGEGYRVLGIAEKTTKQCDEPPYENLRFLGVIGLLDPPRSDVRRSIEDCRKAGIRVVMITGDKAATAAAIGKQTGISSDDQTPLVIHGKELKDPDEMSPNERRHVMEARIFARVSPEQKLHLVKLMQEQGMVTAMTGDGVNDAPALKKADIGIAMGRRGTDAAREVADMVIKDDAFSSIAEAVRQGRIIFDNIRKSVMFMLCTNVAEVMAVGVAAVSGGFFGLPLPLLPLQILYLNVITDVFPALALGMSRGSPDVMNRRPRSREEAVLTRRHWLSIGGWAALMSGCVLASLMIAFFVFDFDHDQAVTVSFLTLAFAKLWFVFNLRDPGTRLLTSDIARNPYIHYAILLCTVLLIASVYLPGLSHVLKTEHPGTHGWLLLLGMSLLPFVWGQGLRIFQRSPKKKPLAEG
jgi:P-type Ca2+ transporter type 2C